MSEFVKIPTEGGLLKDTSQSAVIITSLKVPDEDKFYEIPTKMTDVPYINMDTKWYDKWNWANTNDRKIVQRGIVILYFIHSKKLSLKKETFTGKLFSEFYETFCKEKRIINPNGVFQWQNHIVKNFLSKACGEFTYDMMNGKKDLENLLKKIKRFAGSVESAEPYEIKLFTCCLLNYPETPEYLPKKIAFLSSLISPVRYSSLPECTFEGMTHDPDKKTYEFWITKTKTGERAFYITDHPNAHLSLYRLFSLYISLIGTSWRKGGFFRFYQVSEQNPNAVGYYPPANRIQKTGFTEIRKEMVFKYLHFCPYDIIFEEVTQLNLPPFLRTSNLNNKNGSKRYTDRSNRKTYACGNQDNNFLNDEDLARGYWFSLSVFKDSYSKRNSDAENTRQKKILDHFVNKSIGLPAGTVGNMLGVHHNVGLSNFHFSAMVQQMILTQEVLLANMRINMQNQNLLMRLNCVNPYQPGTFQAPPPGTFQAPPPGTFQAPPLGTFQPTPSQKRKRNISNEGSNKRQKRNFQNYPYNMNNQLPREYPMQTYNVSIPEDFDLEDVPVLNEQTLSEETKQMITNNFLQEFCDENVEEVDDGDNDDEKKEFVHINVGDLLKK